MLDYPNIRTIQLELSTLCNAGCPQCARNVCGFDIPDLPVHKWSLQSIKQYLPVDFIQQLELIYFCGSYGDPFMTVDFIDIAKYFRSVNPNIKLGAHTNASLRTPQFFVECAEVLDFIGFGIDGLEDTNHLYRRNCFWNKIIENANAFIQAGGHAEWDFIVFEHNQHQVETARALSKQLGFAKFNVKKTCRFLNYNHELVDSYNVVDEYKIYPPSDPLYYNRAYDDIKTTDLEQYKAETCIKCNAVRINEIYIGADGYVFPCGWLSDRLYQTTVIGTPDNLKIWEQLEQKPSNVFKHHVRDIVDGEWFTWIKNSWTNENRLDRCAMMCGTGINVIGEQNTDVSYKV